MVAQAAPPKAMRQRQRKWPDPWRAALNQAMIQILGAGDMEISFTGQITQQDYLRAQSLHRRRSTALLIVGGVLFVLIVLSFVVTSVSEPALFWSSLPVVAILAIIFAASWWLPRLQAVRHWRNSKALQNPMSGTITSQAINFTGTYSEGSTSWEAYVKYKRSPDMVLLYLAPNLFNIFPRAFFESDADWKALIELVEKNIPDQ
jgi:hypothetical protein